MNHIIGALWCGLFLLLPVGVEASRPVGIGGPTAGETLQYTVRYRGLLSVFLPVEIATATLSLQSAAETVDDEQLRRATLVVTTEPFPRMESLYSLRFSYDSWFDPGLKYTTVVDMRKQTSDSRHELLWFNRSQGVVHSYRKVPQTGSSAPVLPGFLRQVSRLQPEEKFRERAVLQLTGSDVLDRLAMLYALRQRTLEAGEIVELAVSNGKDLLGYRVAVEAREPVVFDGNRIAALRLSFTPRFTSGGGRDYLVRVWLSDDERRLPLRFHSSRFGGAIELNLERAVDAAG